MLLLKKPHDDFYSFWCISRSVTKLNCPTISANNGARATAQSKLIRFYSWLRCFASAAAAVLLHVFG